MDLLIGLLIGCVGALSSIFTLLVTEVFRRWREKDSRDARREERMNEHARTAKKELRAAYASWAAATHQRSTDLVHYYNRIAQTIRSEELLKVKSPPDPMEQSAVERSRDQASQLFARIRAADKRVGYLTNKLLILETDRDRKTKIRAVAATEAPEEMNKPIYDTYAESAAAREAAKRLHKELLVMTSRIVDDLGDRP